MLQCHLLSEALSHLRRLAPWTLPSHPALYGLCLRALQLYSVTGFSSVLLADCEPSPHSPALEQRLALD